MLKLADLKDYTLKEIKEHLIARWTANDAVYAWDIIVAYESVGDYGCDSSGFYLFKDKASGRFYEVHGSHCSCDGFEGQFTPEETTLEYLKSDKFYMSCGGYDGEANENQNRVKAYLKRLK